MFAETADRHRPTRVEQVMHQHEEERTQPDAQAEHERHEVRVAELLDQSAPPWSRQPTTTPTMARPIPPIISFIGKLTPLAQVERRRHCGSSLSKSSGLLMITF